jgi:AbrB family looped-hinge helix DNA binding protein
MLVDLHITSLPGECDCTPIAQSKLTAQSQISVPAEIPEKLGVGPGSVLDWEERDGDVIVRRAGRYPYRYRIIVVRNVVPFSSQRHVPMQRLECGGRLRSRRLRDATQPMP